MGATPFTAEEELWFALRDGEEYLIEIFERGAKIWKENHPECHAVLVGFLGQFPPDAVERGCGGMICSGVIKLAQKQKVHPRDMMESLVAVIDSNNLSRMLDQVFKLGIEQEKLRAKILDKVRELAFSLFPDEKARLKTINRARKFLRCLA